MDVLLAQLNVTVENGLTTDDAEKRRESAGYYNTVDPPIQCPAWICCLLPCIKHVPSMKAFAQIAPEDAEVKRNGKWIRYDASSLVWGDVIRVEEGDTVPADCTVVYLEPGCRELLVDHRGVTGQEKPISARSARTAAGNNVELLWGSRVVLGSAVAVCTAVGPRTKVAQLIARKRFPVTNNTAEAHTAMFGIPSNADDSTGSTLSNVSGSDEETGMLLTLTRPNQSRTGNTGSTTT